ncbi:DUF418 domain-containing protein [Xylanibacillus composti]|uniref:DUF418 domain-containing protein n=1 Tax=Xylanibacillus composti TaxID=1572762 RepID=A0A8J4M2E6_9BACL|nr:DUF418 domain-containing protein [Xylanibacillus composti]MDT9724855.1 DUF418 domain-containing protein [Xylanibacillus composti]GIQ69050.1 hypothetical protein XYCOK13_18740 [Xylanibacillus composti]
MPSNATNPPSGPRPTATKERALAPDLGRGFMLLLIVLAHAPIYLFMSETFMLTRPLGENRLDDLVNLISLLFVDNRAYPMFAVLFGYGLAVMVTRQLDKGVPEAKVRRLLRRRSWLLIVFGFLHLVLIGGADILATYGLSGLILGWLLFKPERAQRRSMYLIGILYLIFIPLAWFIMYPIMTGVDNMIGLTASHTYVQLATEHATAFPIVLLFQILLYPMLLIIAIGIWSARKRWLELPDRLRPQLKRIAFSGIGISLLGALPYALVGANLWHPQSGAISWLLVLHIFSGVAGGLGYTALIAIIAISVRQAAPKVTNTLAAVGKRSLTFYLYQEAMLVIVLSPVALGIGGKLNSTGAFVVAILIWLSAAGLAAWLERRGWSGPADALLRKLIYRKS